MEKTYLVNCFDRPYMRRLLTRLGATWTESKGWFEKVFTVTAPSSVIASIDEDLEDMQSCSLW